MQKLGVSTKGNNKKGSGLYIYLVSCTGSSLFLGTSTLLGKQNSLDVGQDATLSNGNASEELVQFFVVPS